MEVINSKNNIENREELTNTKVFVIDRNGNIYANGIINGPLKHKDYLLEIIDFLYPENQVAAHIGAGIPEDQVNPFDVAYFLNMMGYAVILNSPSMESLDNRLKYLCVFEGINPTASQRESLKFCLSYFDEYYIDFAANIVAKFSYDMKTNWNSFGSSHGNIPEISPLAAYETYLEDSQSNENVNKLSRKRANS